MNSKTILLAMTLFIGVSSYFGSSEYGQAQESLMFIRTKACDTKADPPLYTIAIIGSDDDVFATPYDSSNNYL